MRYTPYLDRIGVRFKRSVNDHAVNVIDSALSYIDGTIDWGEWQGRKRKPCPEQPFLLAGQPIGQYHCPVCGMMLVAGMPHLSPQKHEPVCTCPGVNKDYPHSWPIVVHLDDCPTRYPDFDYEEEYGRDWPPGYE